MTTDSGRGLWEASLSDPVEAPPLTRDVTVDLAIIGGGFTGTAAALEAARQGASVALLEAQEIGHGGSGRNVGLVNAGLWLPPETILSRLGEAAGRRLIEALGAAPDRVFEIINREDIACEATRNGTLHLAHAPSALSDLRDRQRQGNASGAALRLLDAEETHRRTGARGFAGALLNPAAGTIQPLAYCHGLARAAVRCGAQVFARSPVTAMRHDGAWHLETPGGRVRADKLLIATNAYPEGAARARRPQFAALSYVQFATAPLPPEVSETILPGGEGCWDTGLVMCSIRRDARGRLILGGMGDARGLSARVHAGWARRKLAALYPALAHEPFEHAWSGRIAMTSDHLPRITTPGPNSLSIFGYSGRGIGPGTVLGTEAARALLGLIAPEDLPVPVMADYAEPLAAARSAVYTTGAALVHAISAWRR
ncbi:NAD(P)/FAD-dependent oxidoreductase [Litorisediminicola beolgyonensis]|uniref:NAD(P)/FAD-dependent oxidoreductase n=1 Tax=Litorisediminicola beolgyonensis TaxID=1173614 RepID=A0ABW3ZGM9_9RHOB